MRTFTCFKPSGRLNLDFISTYASPVYYKAHGPASDSQNATEPVDSWLQNFRILQRYETSDGLEFILQQDEGRSKFKGINACQEIYGKLRQYLCFCIAIPHTENCSENEVSPLPYKLQGRKKQIYPPQCKRFPCSLDTIFFCLPWSTEYILLQSSVSNTDSKYTDSYLRTQTG